jgi:hypothetical protein
MRPAALGIAYYAWLSQRLWLKAGLSLVAGLAVIALLPLGEFVRTMTLCPAYLLLLFCCPLFSVIAEERANRIGYPRGLFRTPLPTTTLVFWPWLFGVATLTLWWVPLAVLINLFDKDGVPVLVPALGLAVTIAWLDVAVWAPFRDLALKVLSLVAGMTLPGVFIAWLFLDVGLPYDGIAVILAVCLMLSFPAAVAAVAADRRGDVWLQGLVLSRRPRPQRLEHPSRPRPRYPKLVPDSRAFGSIARAQRWYNWSSPHGRLVSLFGAVALVPLALVLAMSRMDPPGFNPHLLVFGFTVVLPLLAVVPVRLAVHNAGNKIGGDSPGLQESSTFVLLRPITSGRLATTLLQTTLLGVLQSWALGLTGALVVGSCWSVVSPVPGKIAGAVTGYLDRLPVWQEVGLVLLSGFAAVGLTWRLVTNRLIVRPAAGQGRLLYLVAALSNLGQLAFLAITISLLLDPQTRLTTVAILKWLALPVLVAKVLLAAIALRAARREGLLDTTALRQATLLWASLGIPTLGLAAIVLPGLELVVPTGVVMLCAFILLPLGRFALIPLGLEAARHR